jgi:hypothetical protein
MADPASGCGGSSGGQSRTGATAQSGVPHVSAQTVAFAAGMRAHGVSDYPDPQVSGSGNHPDPDHGRVFTLPATVDEQAPAFVRATHDCQNVEPSSLSIDQTR